ncbi:MAG: 2,5-diketo-D-gluconate reductase [Actinomycetota bacterium]|jgi:diketogulonate reductase-like aldo/keto reductase|nr:2,5-diketo-D-gluconate reductase [Actinomycetota bacterium]
MSSPMTFPSDAASLPGGGHMPLLGFGTWQIKGPDAVRATAAALRTGYRHIDTATMYANEAEIGTALADCGIDRSELFVTTKLPGNDAGAPRRTLDESLRKLQTSYVDLWLIHWPTGDDVRLWESFVEARDAGLVRDIGVSNFSVAQLDQLAAQGPMPAVNQIRWSPLLFDPDVLAGHRDRGVVLEGYSALRGGTLDHPVIAEIAARLGRTTAQVILRWHLQHRVVAIPKSQDDQRIAANAELDFELSGADMALLDGLGGSD